MTGIHILGVYFVGVLSTIALFRLRPPQWFLLLVLGAERDLYIARPGADEQQVAHAVAKTARWATVIVGVLWPLPLAVAVLDAPGIAWRRHREKRN